MKVVVDKFLLFFLLSVLGALCDFRDGYIVAMLVGLVASCFIFIFGNRNRTIIVGLIFLVIGIINPYYSVYIPFLFYDFFYYGCPVLCLLGLIDFYIFSLSYSPIYLVFLMAMVFICILLSCRTKKVLTLEKQFKKLRDDSTEQTILLKSQNKSLLESQEYEIHYAKLKERNRIAREIHDNVGHMLSRSLLQVGALLAINKDSHMNEFLNNLKNTLSEAMDSIRSSVHNLHDEAIDLQNTVEELIKGMSQYDIDFTYAMSKTVNQSVKYCFITTVKEALSNVVKHSDATKIIIYMMETESHYQLNIKDNGTEENVKASINSPGMGLENMKERAESLGGAFRINRNEGFQIYLSIPKQQLHEEAV